MHPGCTASCGRGEDADHPLRAMLRALEEVRFGHALFELVVEDRNALDVYYHPYAYAALRGVDFGVAA